MNLVSVCVALFILVVCVVMYDAWRLVRAAHVSSGLISTARAFEVRDVSNTREVLVLGDSTAVGVGSPPALSVPGRLSAWLHSNVENHAKSGARTVDVLAQLAMAKRPRYDLILIQIGANDVTHLGSLSRAQTDLTTALKEASKRSDKVLLLTAGDIGKAPVFAFPLNILVSMRTKDLRARFMAVAREAGAVYVDIYARKDPFASDPKKYYAPDMFHLSPDGYGFWFGIVKEYVQEKWSTLAE